MSTLVQLENAHFIVDMMYARANNMVGRAIYEEIGYGNKAYMVKPLLDTLLKAIPFLEENKLKMRICDAYRPPLAHQKLLEIIPYSRAALFAKTPEESNHCHGTAVDVCLTDINGHNLTYPTQIDAYEKHFQEQVCKGYFDDFYQHLQKARQDYMSAPKEALENRLVLRNLMENIGFEIIASEWWHYNIKNWQQYPVIKW